MNSVKTSLIAAVVVAIFALGVRPAHAMTFDQFDHMAAEDRARYLDFLIKSAEQVLREQGRGSDALRVERLFSDIARAGDKLTPGVAELEENLAAARVRDLQRRAADPHASPVQVESALALTLSKNGIELTPNFIQGLIAMAALFKPTLPGTGKD